MAGHQAECVRLDGHRFAVGDMGQPVVNDLAGQTAKVVTLAAGDDGGQDVVGFGGAEDEDDVRRRLFQCFQKRVGSLRGEHVRFVDDVDLALAFGGQEVDPVANIADFINAPVAGGVQFDDVQVAALVDGGARVALVARVALLGVGAVDGLGQHAGGGGFAGAPRPAEQVAMADSTLHDGLAQGVGNVFLTGQVAEPAGPPFAVVHLRGHIGDGHRSAVGRPTGTQVSSSTEWMLTINPTVGRRHRRTVAGGPNPPSRQPFPGVVFV